MLLGGFSCHECNDWTGLCFIHPITSLLCRSGIQEVHLKVNTFICVLVFMSVEKTGLGQNGFGPEVLSTVCRREHQGIESQSPPDKDRRAEADKCSVTLD